MTESLAPRAGVTANDDVIVAMPPFLNVVENEKVSSVSALMIFPVAASTTSGRNAASHPVTDAISPNQNLNPSM